MQSPLVWMSLLCFENWKTCVWGLEREGDGFGGKVKEVGRGALWAMTEICILFQVLWEASERF